MISYNCIFTYFLASEPHVAAKDDVNVRKIEFRRHLVPRILDKDNEIDEIVTLDLEAKEVNFRPIFPGDPVPMYLPFFYPKVSVNEPI